MSEAQPPQDQPATTPTEPVAPPSQSLGPSLGPAESGPPGVPSPPRPSSPGYSEAEGTTQSLPDLTGRATVPGLRVEESAGSVDATADQLEPLQPSKPAGRSRRL